MTATDSTLTAQPAGWSPDELRVMVTQEQELRSIIVEYYRSQMIEKKHYYILPGAQKPALSKEGALNLCSLFKVRVAADNPHEQHHDDGHYSVRYRVILVSMRTGSGVADGDGYCSTRESKYAYRWMKPADVPDTLDTTALIKRQTRYGSQVRVPTPDLADHYNTVLKMAYKRAIVAASLCLPLVSELFTQDVDEQSTPASPPQTQSRAQRTPQQPPPPQSAAPPPDAVPLAQAVTPQQIQQLWSLIKQHGVDVEAFRVYLAGLGLQSTKELMSNQLTQCLNEIETRQGQAFQLQDTPEAQAEFPTQGTRTPLFKALGMLQAVLTETEATQPPGEPHAQTLIELGQWIPRVARACENPDTPEDQLQTYLTEVNQSLDQLQQMAIPEVATSRTHCRGIPPLHHLKGHQHD